MAPKIKQGLFSCIKLMGCSKSDYKIHNSGLVPFVTVLVMNIMVLREKNKNPSPSSISITSSERIIKFRYHIISYLFTSSIYCYLLLLYDIFFALSLFLYCFLYQFSNYKVTFVNSQHAYINSKCYFVKKKWV